jgi:hypothetical protein
MTFESLKAEQFDFGDAWRYMGTMLSKYPEAGQDAAEVMRREAKFRLLNDLQLETGINPGTAEGLAEVDCIVDNQKALLREALAALQVCLTVAEHGALGDEESKDAKRYKRFLTRYEQIRSGFAGLKSQRGFATVRRVKISR